MRPLVPLFCLLGACATTSGSTHPSTGLTFIDDDYPAALAEAKARAVPLFVDAWAPWCHSCVFLREHVMHDPALKHNESRYVFVSIDTEKPSSAAFLERHPVEVWPTLMIIDPKTDTTVLKWLGTGTVAQLEKLLDDGAVAVAAPEGADPVALLAHADRLYAEGKGAESAVVYGEAFNAMPVEHPRRARTLESWLNALTTAKDYRTCAQFAPRLEALPRGPSFVNGVVLALSCATSLEMNDAVRARAITQLEPLAKESLTLDGILADDKSGVYELLAQLAEERNDEAGQKAIGREWLTFLEGEAAKAKTPATRAVFDPHRVNAALAMKEPLRAEAALLQSEKDLPDDYNPPARLALIYREAGRYADALAALERAFAKSYGPRKLRLYEIKAGVFEKQGDVSAERVTLKEALEFGNALPSSQRPARTLQRIEDQLAGLRSPER